MEERIEGWQKNKWVVFGNPRRSRLVLGRVDENVREEDLAEVTFGMSWAWCGAQGMSERGDTWTVFFREGAGQKSWFGEFVAPPVWEGRWTKTLLLANGEGGVLHGVLREQGLDEEVWVTNCHKVGPPQIPNLGPGSETDFEVSEGIFLGVLRWSHYSGRHGSEGVEMNVAWGKPDGSFWGWEKITGMNEAHHREKTGVHSFNLPDPWEQLETEIRASLWGREI